MPYSRAFPAGAKIPGWLRLFDNLDFIWHPVHDQDVRVFIVRSVLLLNICAMLVVSAVIATVTVTSWAQQGQNSLDHYRLEQLQHAFEKTDADHRLTVIEQVQSQTTERVANIENLVRWVAFGVAGVLGKSVLEFLLAVGLRRKLKNPEPEAEG